MAGVIGRKVAALLAGAPIPELVAVTLEGMGAWLLEGGVWLFDGWAWLLERGVRLFDDCDCLVGCCFREVLWVLVAEWCSLLLVAMASLATPPLLWEYTG